MGKIETTVSSRKRHNPLERDIASDGGNLKKRFPGSSEKGSSQHDGFYDASISRKILKLAKSQQEELDEDTNSQVSVALELDDELQRSVSDMEEYDMAMDQAILSDNDYEEESQVILHNENDQSLVDSYFGNAEQATVTLADKIMAKIQEKELRQASADDIVSDQQGVRLPPKVIAAYQKIGQILSTYRHGKLPKLFKVLPSLRNWEDVLFVTDPGSWTPHAVCEATKLFVSNLSSNEAQIFIETVLLPKFRQSIEDSDNHTLDYHLYRALKKSLYKPAAFFKGFLLPLVDDQCTLREAMIASSVLSKISIPSLHSSVALTQLAQRSYTPARTVFIRVLIEKKYALPYQTLDDLVFYFMRFRQASNDDQILAEDAVLPVVWHKAFLAFAQRYKNDITDDQRDFLLETLRQRFHGAIGPDIRRELVSGSNRSTATDDLAMERAF